MSTTTRNTWYRQLFEAQLAAYSPNSQSANQPIRCALVLVSFSLSPDDDPLIPLSSACAPNRSGFYFWTWRTSYGIPTWDYQCTPPLASPHHLSR